MAGSDRVLTRTIQSEPRLETRKPSTRAKWRSSTSAYASVLENVLDTADIVRDGDVTPMVAGLAWELARARQMPKSVSSPHRTATVALFLLASCFGQQVETHFGYAPQQRILNVLSQAHVSGSLVYSGACQSHVPQNATVPDVRAPRELGSPITILQDMFTDNPKMRVTQDSGNRIRMVETGVPSDVLGVRIHHISFRDEDTQYRIGGLEFRGPNVEMMRVLRSPEVQAFERAHNIEATGFRAPENALNSELPTISGELNDVTVSQAFDYILKTFPGFWVYENCAFEDGSRSVHFWFF